MSERKEWTGPVPEVDSFGDKIRGKFIDGKTIMGAWAIMTPRSHHFYGQTLGIGGGQAYILNRCGKWVTPDLTELTD